MDKQLEILNNIREELHIALNKKRTYPVRWNTKLARFESSAGGYSFEPEEKAIVKQVFSKHGIKVGFFCSRAESGYTIKVDDPGLINLTK